MTILHGIHSIKDELSHIFFDHLGHMARVGMGDVTRILLAADGNGTGGRYDRVHVLKDDWEHLVYVAHQLAGWRLLGETK